MKVSFVLVAHHNYFRSSSTVWSCAQQVVIRFAAFHVAAVAAAPKPHDAPTRSLR